MSVIFARSPASSPRNALLTAAFTAFAWLPSLALAQAPAVPPAKSATQITEHRLALQISDNDADKMNAVLNVAANVSQYYSGKGEEIVVEVVAFNAGLHMLRDDTSPVKVRLRSFAQSMPNVSFKACRNTLDAMTRKEGKQPPLVANAELVPAGVIRLIELSEKGWTIVRP